MKSKSLSNLLGKKFREVGAVLTLTSFLFGCQLFDNLPPDTNIEKRFLTDEIVEYTFSGTDLDGSIDYISAMFNDDGNYKIFSNNSSYLVPVIDGLNRVEATAYDNLGAKDLNPAKDSFNSSK